MKKINLILVLILLQSCNIPLPGVKIKNNSKYEIIDSTGEEYYTSQYKIKGECVEFEGAKLRPSHIGEFKICGSYTIKRNRFYKKSY